VILNEEASRFVDYMKDKRIAVRRYYTATHALKFYQGQYRRRPLDYTNQIKDRVVALPIHTIMSDAEMNYLFDAVASYFGRTGA
jgi:dTDP-4-amino-4,6-dideoxygalactose transaminase